MRIRLALLEELPAVLQIFDAARTAMRENGNDQQWINGYPSKELLEEDVVLQRLYVCEDESSNELLAAFVFAVMDDPTYHEIDGAWICDEPYGVVHRIGAKAGHRGVGTFCIQWAQEQAALLGAGGGIRIDTHALNAPMHALLGKLGFTKCGIITIEDGTLRTAYQRLSK